MITVRVEFRDGEHEALMFYEEEFDVSEGDRVTVHFDGCGLTRHGDQWALAVPVKVSAI